MRVKREIKSFLLRKENAQASVNVFLPAVLHERTTMTTTEFIDRGGEKFCY